MYTGVVDVTAAIESTPEEQIFERCITGRRPLPRWRSEGGLVGLLGDAAHATHPRIGQGAMNRGDFCVLSINPLMSCVAHSTKAARIVPERFRTIQGVDFFCAGTSRGGS